ncbi:glutathione S-transferase family protein [Paracidovorax citrulli]
MLDGGNKHRQIVQVKHGATGAAGRQSPWVWTMRAIFTDYPADVHRSTVCGVDRPFRRSLIWRETTMTPILFYGVPSGCSFGSIVAPEWLGQPYRLCRIEMPEVVGGEDFRRINPIGETPALATEAGEIITESMAILNWIGARGIETSLGFAQGSSSFDRLNQMLGYLNTTFFNAFAPLWHLYEHAGDDAAKAVLREYGQSKVRKAHAQLDALLGEREWLLGDQRSVADAYFAGIARWTDYHDVVRRADFPNLDRLYRRLQDDAAVRFAHGIEAQQPVRCGAGLQSQIDLEQAWSEIVSVRQRQGALGAVPSGY